MGVRIIHLYSFIYYIIWFINLFFHLELFFCVQIMKLRKKHCVTHWQSFSGRWSKIKLWSTSSYCCKGGWQKTCCSGCSRNWTLLWSTKIFCNGWHHREGTRNNYIIVMFFLKIQLHLFHCKKQDEILNNVRRHISFVRQGIKFNILKVSIS